MLTPQVPIRGAVTGIQAHRCPNSWQIARERAPARVKEAQARLEADPGSLSARVDLVKALRQLPKPPITPRYGRHRDFPATGDLSRATGSALLTYAKTLSKYVEDK